MLIVPPNRSWCAEGATGGMRAGANRVLETGGALAREPTASGRCHDRVRALSGTFACSLLPDERPCGHVPGTLVGTFGRGCIVRVARAAYSCRTEATRWPLQLARAFA